VNDLIRTLDVLAQLGGVKEMSEKESIAIYNTLGGCRAAYHIGRGCWAEARKTHYDAKGWRQHIIYTLGESEREVQEIEFDISIYRFFLTLSRPHQENFNYDDYRKIVVQAHREGVSPNVVFENQEAEPARNRKTKSVHPNPAPVPNTPPKVRMNFSRDLHPKMVERFRPEVENLTDRYKAFSNLPPKERAERIACAIDGLPRGMAYWAMERRMEVLRPLAPFSDMAREELLVAREVLKELVEPPELEFPDMTDEPREERTTKPRPNFGARPE